MVLIEAKPLLDRSRDMEMAGLFHFAERSVVAIRGKEIREVWVDLLGRRTAFAFPATIEGGSRARLLFEAAPSFGVFGERSRE